MEKLSDHLYIEPMGKIIEDRRAVEAAKAVVAKTHRRSYAAGRVNGQNANWSTQPTGANFERRISLQALRARARQASRDNGHIKHFLAITRANVIGPKGIRLQSRATLKDGMTLDIDLNRKVEMAWREWKHAENCTISNKLNWKAVQNLTVTQLACDGEFLVEMIEDTANPFGFSLKVWDVNWLDETWNVIRPGVNRIMMSVEVDDNDKPVAYWLTQPPNEFEIIPQPRRRRRVPADQMIHGYLVQDDESQVRGVTAFHAALLNMKNYQSYEEGVIQSARMGANIPFFLKQDVADENAGFTGEESSVTGEELAPMIDVSNLAVNALPQGWSLDQYDPKQPTQQHAEFAKTVLMGLGAALGVPYFLLANDWEAVNYSSSRGGLNEARNLWMGMQDFVATTLCRRVFQKWARSAFLTGALDITPAQFAAIQDPKWIARGWDYIDPTKDVAADVLRLQNRLVTPSELCAERGEDYIEKLDRWQSDRKLAAARGIDIDMIYTQPKQLAAELSSPPQDQNPTDDQPAPPPAKKAARELTNGHDIEVIG